MKHFIVQQECVEFPDGDSRSAIREVRVSLPFGRDELAQKSREANNMGAEDILAYLKNLLEKVLGRAGSVDGFAVGPLPPLVSVILRAVGCRTYQLCDYYVYGYYVDCQHVSKATVAKFL